MRGASPSLIIYDEVADLAQPEEEDIHWACCAYDEVLARGERLYAYCGKDVTDDPVAGSDEPVNCPTCIQIDNQECEIDPRTDRCVTCPQELLRERTSA